MTDALITLRDFIRYAASRFNAAGLSFTHGYDSALDEATFLVLHSLHLPHDLPPAYAGARLTADERALLHVRIAERLERRPLAYITGEAWFAGMAFKVTPGVLIPRSPIAELIESGFAPWLSETPEHILDLCTGSGCIAIACAMRFPQAQIDATDISEEALTIARFNAQQHGVSERVEVLGSDLFGALRGRHYDLIVSNPPYVSVGEHAALAPEFGFEPALALVSGSDGLSVPLAILADAPNFLHEDGWLVLEVGASESALLQRLPDLPGTWADFERGGSGVLVLRAAELAGYLPQILRAIAERAEEL